MRCGKDHKGVQCKFKDSECYKCGKNRAHKISMLIERKTHKENTRIRINQIKSKQEEISF
jgi:hypothetical protein